MARLGRRFRRFIAPGISIQSSASGFLAIRGAANLCYLPAMTETSSLAVVRGAQVEHTLQHSIDEHANWTNCIVIGSIRNGETVELIVNSSGLSYFECLGMLQDALFEVRKAAENA